LDVTSQFQLSDEIEVDIPVGKQKAQNFNKGEIMRYFMFFILLAALFTLGCENQMVKDVTVNVEEDTLTPLQKSQAAMERVNMSRMVAYQKAQENGDFSVLFLVGGMILETELGFDVTLFEKILQTWEDGHDERVQSLYQADKIDESLAEAQKNVNFLSYYFPKFDFENNSGGEYFLEYMSAYDDIVTEYLRLSYENPNNTQEQLLTLLKDSIVAGKVSIIFDIDVETAP
jgi:hypothetical protein